MQTRRPSPAPRKRAPLRWLLLAASFLAAAAAGYNLRALRGDARQPLAAGVGAASGAAMKALCCSVLCPVVRQCAWLSSAVHQRPGPPPPQLSAGAFAEAHYLFPELGFFWLQPGPAAQCSGAAERPALSLQYALRLCMGSSACSAVEWAAATQSARLCGGGSSDSGSGEQGLGRLQTLGPSGVYTAYKRPPARPKLGSGAVAEGQPCPQGQVLVRGSSQRDACTVCQEGRCR